MEEAGRKRRPVKNVSRVEQRRTETRPTKKARKRRGEHPRFRVSALTQDAAAAFQARRSGLLISPG